MGQEGYKSVSQHMKLDAALDEFFTAEAPSQDALDAIELHARDHDMELDVFIWSAAQRRAAEEQVDLQAI